MTDDTITQPPVTPPPTAPLNPPSVEKRRSWFSRLRARAILSDNAIVALPVLFNLWILRAEVRVVENVNEGSVHAAMIRWAARRFELGRIPLDGWFPYLSGGSPLFHQSQSFPHIIAGMFATGLGGDRVYTWSLYLLLATWPITVYIGARLLDWDRRKAAGAAFVAPLLASAPGFGYELASYVFAGYGLWSQLWGMWLLPLALGLTWRAVRDRRYATLAAIVVSLTIVSHGIAGYFAVIAVAVWILLDSRRELRSRATVGAAVAAVGVVAASWLLLPALGDRRWIPELPADIGRDSYGIGQVLRWLFTARLFDQTSTGNIRFPIVTILVGVGLVVAVVRARNDARARGLLGLWVVAIVLYSGRATFGALLTLLPGSSSTSFLRYIAAVHMTAILTAGVGAGWILEQAVRLGRTRLRLRPVAATVVLAIVGIGLLTPAWLERARYATSSKHLIETQDLRQAFDRGSRARLIDVAHEAGGGRVYAGLPTNWGRAYVVGYVPGYISLLNHDQDGIGFTNRVGSLIAQTEPRFNDADPRQYELFGIKYLLLPQGRIPPVRARFIDQDGAHALWEFPRGGYASVADTVPPITADRSRENSALEKFLSSRELRRGLYPTVEYLGRPAAEPTVPTKKRPKGPAGTIDLTKYDDPRGQYRLQITANRRAAVILHSSFHGRWRADVDGRSEPVYMVAPGLPAVTVSRGTHVIAFTYLPYPFYPLLFALAVLALLALWYAMRRAEPRERVPVERVEPAAAPRVPAAPPRAPEPVWTPAPMAPAPAAPPPAPPAPERAEPALPPLPAAVPAAPPAAPVVPEPPAVPPAPLEPPAPKPMVAEPPTREPAVEEPPAPAEPTPAKPPSERKRPAARKRAPKEQPSAVDLVRAAAAELREDAARRKQRATATPGDEKTAPERAKAKPSARTRKSTPKAKGSQPAKREAKPRARKPTKRSE